MKAVVLHGSPRRNGETIKLLKKFMEGLEDSGCEVEFIDASRINVSDCTGCLQCEKNGECVIRDDMDNIYRLIEESDIVVVSSPVYFASVTAQLKSVIDRCQTLYSRRYVLKQEMKKKDGYLIFTAGCENKKMIDSMELLGRFFMLSCNGDIRDSIYALGTDKIHVEERKELLKEAYEKGLRAGGV